MVRPFPHHRQEVFFERLALRRYVIHVHLVRHQRPQDRDLVVDALQGTLAIEGESVAQASLAAAPVHLPANGTARAEMNAHAGMDAVLRAIAAAMRRGAMILGPGERPALRYTIEGSAVLAGGARVPFRRSGELGEPRS
jgi:hypothetical protein